jgi:O-antigen ligase
MMIAGLGLSGFWLLLGVTGVLSTFGLALFLVALSWAVLAVAQACGELWDPTDALRSARRVVSFVVVLALPVAFDPGTAERYGVSKFTVLLIGALVLAALWVVDALTNVTMPDLRTGLHWPILAMVVVGGLATIFSISPKLSLIGAYQSYDGYLALVSFAVLALIAAESWRPSDLRRILTTFLIASGGLVVLYGLIQTADVELSTHWDWIQFLNFQASFGPTSTVWSTFGNPNHLAGFVACLLPIGIIVVISDKSVVTRILAGAVLAGGLLCLVETSSLGGLGAAVGALVLTALLLIPELRSRKRMAAWLGAGVAVAVAVAVVIVAAQGTLGHKLDAATQWSSGTSTAAQRVQFWHSALDMAADRPLLGWGPDTFGYMSPTYQTKKFVDAVGPDQVINGAHNTFAQTLATKGILGLAALLFFLLWLGLRAWGGWRHVRAHERRNPEWREQRLVLTAAIGAAVGVFLQNSFNVEILGINVVLWAMAAAMSVVALGAGVPVGLNPAAILRVEPAEEAVPLEAPRRPHRRPARRGSIALPLGIATVVVLALSWFGSTWWRADRSYQYAVEGSAVLAQPDSSSAEQTRALNSTLKAFRDAARQNTIESRYPLTEATFQLGVLAAANALNTDNVQALDQTKDLLQDAVDRGPRDPVSLASYGRLLARLRELSPASGDLEKEADLFTRAARSNPYNVGYVSSAATAWFLLQNPENARDVVDIGLDKSPSDRGLLTQAVAAAKAQGDIEAADGYQSRLDAIPAG